MDLNEYKKTQGRRFEGEAVKAHPRQRGSYKFFKQFITPDMSVLDIGTRDGWMVEYLRRKKFVKVMGMEIVDGAVQHAQKCGRNVVWGDVHDLSRFNDGEFGAILMMHSLEHCHTPTKAIEEVSRVLRDGGLFYVEVPAEEEIHRDVAHFHCFNSIREVNKMLGTRFQLLCHRIVRWDKDHTNICGIFRKKSLRDQHARSSKAMV